MQEIKFLNKKALMFRIITSLACLFGSLIAETFLLKVSNKSEVVLVLDTSKSMEGNPIDEVKYAAKCFVERTDSNLETSLITFNSTSTL